MPIRPAVLAALLSLAASAEESTTLSLGVGQQKVLRIANVQRVAIGDPEIADARQVGGELLVTGIGEGRTSLLIWQRDDRRLSYVVQVRRQDPRELLGEVRAAIGDREGVLVRASGEHIFLEGETATVEDAQRVQEVASLYPQVKSLVHPSAAARKASIEALNRTLRNGGLKGVEAKLVGSTVYLEGWVESQDELKRLDLFTRSFGEKIESLVTVGMKRMVLVEVEFVEAARGDNKSIGVKPPLHFASTGDTGAKVTIGGPIPGLDASGAQKVGTFAANLDAATDFSVGARFDNGVVRVLSRPRLVCASGEKCEFLAGGEVPILVATQNQFAVEWKKFGIVLNVTPTADRSGHISSEIYAEVSDVDRSLSVRANGFDVPGFRVRNVKTSVGVREGETIILSGLFNYSEDKEVSKVPFLGHIPILGELFKSRNFVDRKTELAIYVTPRLIVPGGEKVKELIDDARKLYRDAGDAVSFSVFD